jgi:hypothetical protein
MFEAAVATYYSMHYVPVGITELERGFVPTQSDNSGRRVKHASSDMKWVKMQTNMFGGTWLIKEEGCIINI